MASEIKVDTIVNAGGDNDSGIDLATNDNIKFNIAGSQKAIIDSSGNVGIGTTSPQSNLHVTGTAKVATGNSQGILGLGEGNGTTVNVGLWRGAANAPTSDGNFLNLGGYDGIVFAASNAAIGSQTERMRINSSGAVMIGTTSSPNNAPLLIHCATDDNIRIKQETHAAIQGVNDAANAFVALKIDGNDLLLNSQSREDVLIGCTALPSDSVGGAGFESAGDDRMILNLSSTTTSNRNVVVFRNPNGAVGTINTSGTTTGFNTSSDYRLKENVVTDWDATSRLKKLKPSRFNFKADKDTTVDGFLAHEVSSIVPVAVSGEKDETQDLGTIKDKDGNVISENVLETQTKKDDGQTWTKTKTEDVYQGIDQSKLVPLLTKALQEAIAKIETLEAKVTALESK